MERRRRIAPGYKHDTQNTSTRYSARYLMLIYTQTAPRFDPLEIQRLASRWRAQCTIVQQSQPNNSTNKSCSYLAFVDFVGKRFQTRNLGCFDIQGHHPRWLHLTSSPWRHLDQMVKRGCVVWDSVSRPSEITTKNVPSSTGKSPIVQWEFLGSASNEASFLDLCESQMPKESLDAVVRMLDQPAYPSSETELSRNVRYWQDGYRAGFEAALSSGSKTQPEELGPAGKLDPADLDELGPLGDDPQPLSLQEEWTCTDDSIFAAVDRIEGDVIQIDWESFELGNPDANPDLYS